MLWALLASLPFEGCGSQQPRRRADHARATYGSTHVQRRASARWLRWQRRGRCLYPTSRPQQAARAHLELALTMLVATQRGRECTAAEYGALLGAAGFARPEVRRMQNVLERHCVVGWKA